jgi:transcriptional regulator with PAS, ATPase and Fis domain
MEISGMACAKNGKRSISWNLKMSKGDPMELEALPCLTETAAEESIAMNPLVGNSPKMRQVRSLINKIADSNSTILITGESGTGKELAARAIHELSQRREQPFVPVNCGAIPEELLESELFGHVRGAFTGAVNSRQGRFQLANGGTLFLDEIGEMSPKLQVKLLRVLQERQFEPVGSDRAVQVDVRVVAATNRDLHVAVREGKFREDLFYRLNVLPVQLPSLREREGDIPLLVKHFLVLHGLRKGKRAARVEPEAMAVLESYRWPGNVREVENLVERLIVLNEDGVIRINELPDYVVQHGSSEQSTAAALPASGMDLDRYLEKIENGFICQALERARGNKTVAAGMLNLNRTTFIERLRKKGLLTTARQNTNTAVANVTENRRPGTDSDPGFWSSNGFSIPHAGKYDTVIV